ncbi:MAG: hypothetical protein LUQ62_02720, partial [Methanomicrobiales archaeon]|nr:hypothetical protein [Methanomicrobiales archaeon]
LFVPMLKEEWRVHSTMFGSVSFALFPVLIAAITLMGSVILPYMEDAISGRLIGFLVHAMFLLMGAMVGGFGLLGKEVMNRRFGQASLLAYSSRTLPLSDRQIFAAFVTKDTVYYLLLWVVPFLAGLALGTPLSGLPLSFVGLATLSLTLSFLSGLATIFFLSTLYAHSLKLVAAVIVAGVLSAILLTGVGGMNPQFLFPPYALFRGWSPALFLLSLGMITIFSTVSILYMTAEFPDREKRFANRFGPLSGRLEGFRYAPLVAKDILDLWRSGGLVGQMLFSFLLPMGIIWFTLSVLGRIIPPTQILITFAGVAGVIAATMYTWVTEFDTLGAYTFLPLGTADLIRSKFASFLLLQPLTAATVGGLAVLSGNPAAALPAAVLALSVAVYACGVMIFLTGLWPAVMVYSVRVFAASLLLIGPVLLVLIGISSLSLAHAVLSVFLILPAFFLIRLSFRRWETWEKAFL